jgi:hypothetical protein
MPAPVEVSNLRPGFLSGPAGQDGTLGSVPMTPLPAPAANIAKLLELLRKP